jgi:uncharacterized protein YqjF (DUF2071 family)
MLRQSWRRVAFAHWPVDSGAVRHRLPADLAVDEHDGTAWLTLVALLIDRVRLGGVPPLPGTGAFLQTNLRTYVTGPGGTRGVWFFSLDATSLAVALGARVLLGAPYHHADLAIHDAPGGAGVRYSGRRLASGAPAAYRIELTPGAFVDPDGLDVWLTHRWRAFTRHAGRTVEVPVHHGPWLLRRATLHGMEETLTSAAGLVVGDPARLHWSDGLDDVVFGVPRPHRQGSRGRPLSA